MRWALNMPQPSIGKGFEACYVNRLSLLAIFLFLQEVSHESEFSKRNKYLSLVSYAVMQVTQYLC
jgi:hypothetical protein